MEKESETPLQKVGFFRLFQFSDALDKFLVSSGVILCSAAGALIPFLFIYFSEVLAVFGEFTFTGDIERFQRRILDYTIIFCIFGVAVFVAEYFGTLCWKITGERQAKRIREMFLKSLLKQDMSWFDGQKSGDLSSRLSGDMYLIQEGISEKVGLTCLYLCQFFSGFIVAYIRGWQMALVLTLAVPVLVGLLAGTSKVLAGFTVDSQKTYGEAGALAMEVLGAIRTVIAFGGQESEAERYDHILFNSLKARTKRAFSSGAGFGLVGFCIYGFIALALWYGSTLIADGSYNGENVVNVFFAFLIGSFSLGNLGPYVAAFGAAQGAAFFVFNTIKRTPIVVSGDKKPKIEGSIEFKNVSFTYPSRPDVPILKSFNLTIPKGKTIAFVGASGSGKSTLIQLVQRFYDPLEGQILVDGSDLRDMDLKHLRSSMSIVSQEPCLFRTTIAKNIQMGLENATMQQIEAVAKDANALDFISALPQKFESSVGERGGLVSGGQKQRIAIARALIKNPKILLLDEATSALDSQSERIVQEALEKASVGRTTLVIAHRLSTIQNADMIVVMENGVILETGTHGELLAKNGKYTELVNAQSLGVDPEVKEKAKETGSRESLVKVVEVKEATKANVQRKGTTRAAFFRVFRMSLKEWRLFFLGVFASIGLGLVFPLFSLYFGTVLSLLFTSDRSQVVSDISFWALVFVYMGLGSAVANFLQFSMFEISGYRLTTYLRSQSFRAMMRQDVGWFDDEKHASSILNAKLSSETEVVQSMVGSILGQVFQALVNVVVGTTIAFSNGWKLAAVLIAMLPINSFGLYIETKANIGGNSSKELYEESSQAASEAIGNVRTVISLNREDYFQKQYADALQKPYDRNIKSAYFTSAGNAFAQSNQFFIYALSYWYGAQLVGAGEISFVNMNIVIQAVFFMTLALSQASALAPNFTKGLESAVDIFEIIDRKPEIEGSVGKDFKSEGSVSFNKVDFKYPTRPDQTVLNELDISVKPGETIGLVGASGSGKSTVLQLVLRFYDANNGQVCLDKEDISKVTLKDVRECMAIVSQEPILFARSIKENIGFARPNVTMEEITQAAKMANIHSFIEELPEKYDTFAGDKGAQLSGGQKQRIAIARAMIRNPKILLLDEATSALDTASERVVQDALDVAARDRTTLVIAHRLSTIQNADVIYVFKEGKVVEKGSHKELVELKGFYYQLVLQQSVKR